MKNESAAAVDICIFLTEIKALSVGELSASSRFNNLHSLLLFMLCLPFQIAMPNMLGQFPVMVGIALTAAIVTSPFRA
jgi:hypothetical protein